MLQKAKESELAVIISKLQKDVASISKTINDQKNWRNYLEEREKMLKVIPPAKRKSLNSHVLLDSVKIDCNEHNELLVLVSSNAPHFKRRQIIRETWGNKTNWSTEANWKVIFVLGGTKDEKTLKLIHKESEEHHDLVLEDISEGFYQLSYKVMIGLHWAYSMFRFNFILKCDDDVFVQIDHMMSRLHHDYKNEGYIGNVMQNASVIRKGRYGLSKEEHEKDKFDPYCSGGGFILSHSTIGKIIPFFDWKSPLKIDDAYVGKLVFQAGVKAFHISSGFYMWNNWCEYNEHLLISHPVKKIECMSFLLDHSLIENGKLVNDKIKYKKHLFGPQPTTEPAPKQ